jgi:superfamily II DNA or RNA helicase
MITDPLVTVILHSAYTEIQTYHQGLKSDLNERLSYDQPNAMFTKAYQRQHWTGKIRLFKKNRCPVGLTVRALEIIHHWVPADRVAIKDLRPHYSYTTTRFDGVLRPEYQVPAVKAALDTKQGILWAPPRAGKTMISAGIIASRFMTPTLFIVERLVLKQQTVNALQARLPDIKVGQAGGGVFEPGDVVVCTIQTLLAAYRAELKEQELSLKIEDLDDKAENLDEDTAKQIRELNKQAKMVIVDECHHARAPSYGYVLAQQDAREYCIGLSGTPWVAIDNAKEWKTEIKTGRNLALEAVMGSIIYQVSYETLLTLKYLVPPICYFVKIPTMPGLSGKKYQEVYSAYVTDPSAPRNRILAAVAKSYIARGKTVLVTVGRITHGEALRDMIPGSTWLHGADPELVRSTALKLLNDRESTCIISTLLGEGVDIPELDVVINAEGGYSSQKLLQRQRSMTSNGKKEVCLYVDCLDSVKYLNRHSKYRFDLLSHVPGFKVQVVEPPKDL